MLKKLFSFFFEIIQVVVMSISVFLFIYLLVLQPHKIKGASMEPNFQNNEYLLTDKLSYRFGEPQRGDVVVFKAPPDFNDEFIKRIIALPNEQVTIETGKILVNGKPLEERYLPMDFATAPGKFTLEGKTVTVPEDAYFVLGDNRQHSLDSRNFGFVERDKITGRAWFIYWPPSKAGVIQSPAYFF